MATSRLRALVDAATGTEPPITIPASAGAGEFSDWLRKKATLRDLAPTLALGYLKAVEALRIVHTGEAISALREPRIRKIIADAIDRFAELEATLEVPPC